MSIQNFSAQSFQASLNPDDRTGLRQYRAADLTRSHVPLSSQCGYKQADP